ncbi:MAG TPA: glycosyltransferase [bacterium]|jgi:dolichol-phosphate mannosyltransferase
MDVPKYNFSLSVVIPVFNDEEALPELHRRLLEALKRLNSTYEIIFVDDGSRDDSVRVLRELQRQDPSMKILELSRNFGQPNAISAGLDASSGDILVLMDSDLQDRPEDIELLLEAMLKSRASMAIARWSHRGDSPLRVAASAIFNSLANKITSVQYVPRTRVFRVMKREVIEGLRQFHERTATPLSLLNWMGCDFVVVDLNRDSRYAGKSGYTLGRILKLSLDRIFSHSLFPIRLASVLGIFLGLISVLLAAYFVIQKLFLMKVVPGWTSIVVIILFLQGMSFLFMGIIGEYLGRIYIEAKKRPKYIVKRTHEAGKGRDPE